MQGLHRLTDCKAVGGGFKCDSESSVIAVVCSLGGIEAHARSGLLQKDWPQIIAYFLLKVFGKTFLSPNADVSTSCLMGAPCNPH